MPQLVIDTTRFWIKAQERINSDKKLRFFKTHAANIKIDGFDYTDQDTTKCAIYIVRDPRNVFTSLKNHYQLNDNQAIKWMTNDKNFIYYIQKFERVFLIN